MVNSLVMAIRLILGMQFLPDFHSFWAAVRVVGLDYLPILYVVEFPDLQTGKAPVPSMQTPFPWVAVPYSQGGMLAKGSFRSVPV